MHWKANFRDPATGSRMYMRFDSLREHTGLRNKMDAAVKLFGAEREFLFTAYSVDENLLVEASNKRYWEISRRINIRGNPHRVCHHALYKVLEKIPFVQFYLFALRFLLLISSVYVHRESYISYVSPFSKACHLWLEVTVWHAGFPKIASQSSTFPL